MFCTISAERHCLFLPLSYRLEDMCGKYVSFILSPSSFPETVAERSRLPQLPTDGKSAVGTAFPLSGLHSLILVRKQILGTKSRHAEDQSLKERFVKETLKRRPGAQVTESLASGSALGPHPLLPRRGLIPVGADGQGSGASTDQALGTVAWLFYVAPQVPLALICFRSFNRRN